MQGPYTQSYLPLGDLHLRFDDAAAAVEGYERGLDLDRAVAPRVPGRRRAFTREVFAASPTR